MNPPLVRGCANVPLVKAIAPAKLILGGEHAVVYGQPAVAMAIDLNAQAVITAGDFEGDVQFDLPDLQQQERFTIRALRELKERALRNYRLFLEGQLSIREVVRKPVELFEFAFITVLDGLHLKFAERLDIRMNSNIPMGYGLGSSAATVLSLLRAAGHYFRVEFRPDWYYKYSLEAEKMQHGFPSGVDSYVSLHGGCVCFQNGEARPLPLPRVPMTLIHTGAPACTTGECVDHVRKTIGPNHPIWSEFGEVAAGMEQALLRSDAAALRDQVRANHRLLTRIGVVPKKAQEFAAEMERLNGAAKVCGGGAVTGDTAGAMLTVGPRPPPELCKEFGYTARPVRGEPLGVRIV